MGSHRAECCLCHVRGGPSSAPRTLRLSSFRHAAPAHRPGIADKRRPDLLPLLNRALRCDTRQVGWAGSGRPPSLTGHQLANRCLDCPGDLARLWELEGAGASAKAQAEGRPSRPLALRNTGMHGRPLLRYVRASSVASSSSLSSPSWRAHGAFGPHRGQELVEDQGVEHHGYVSPPISVSNC